MHSSPYFCLSPRRRAYAIAAGVAAAMLSVHCGSSNSGSMGTTEDGGSASGTSSGASSSSASSGGSATSSGTTSSGVGTSSGTSSGSQASSSGTTSGTSSGTSSGAGTSSSGTVITGDGGTGGPQSVLQRGNDVMRHATFEEPNLTIANAPMMAPDATFNGNATFPANGNMQNQGTPSVLYLEEGPAAAGCPAGATGCTATTRAAGNGVFLAFAALGSTPNVFAFDETSGLPVWTAHVAAGGDGIRGTPVIDAPARKVYIVTGGNPHMVHAVSVDTGVEVTTGGWPVTLSATTVKYNGTGFNSGAQNQHGASLLVGNILYIPFGGQYGDGGNYLGWVVAVDVTNPANVAGWATQSSRSGIWGAGGLASDGTGVFAVTGDTTSTARNVSDSQEVVRLTGMAAFTRSAANVFVPTEASGWDKPQADLDYGASTPAYVPLAAGSNPSGVLVSPAKAGRLFVLNGPNLSGGTYDANRTPGGALADLVVSGVTGETVYTSPTIYTSASGLHATINVGGGAQGCPGGNPAGQEAIVSALIPTGAPGTAKIAWCAASGAGGGHTNYPPISTTTDGASANAIVWYIAGSQLVGLNGDTGAKLVETTGAACTGVPSLSFPIAVKNRIVVSALGHLCSWSVGGN